MQAIQTKYIPATNTKHSRIKAWCERGSIITSYDTTTNDEDAHIAAAGLLVAKFATEDFKKYGTPHANNPWNRPRITGGLPGGGYAHVFTSF